MRARLRAFFSLFLTLAACGGANVRQGGTPSPQASTSPSTKAGAVEGAVQGAPDAIELVESAPIETPLDHADIREAAEVWPEMIERAARTLDVAEFYASEADAAHLAQSKLAPVVAAIERAAARGVRVRFLADASFVSKYPETLGRLREAKVDVRTLDVARLSGGILHAKYFVVDGMDSFLGSQNFDWRALAHIQEMGVRVHSPGVAGALEDVFETDWALAAEGADPSTRVHAHGTAPIGASGGERVRFVASPKGWLPDESEWELPRIVAQIDAASRRVDVQLLTYSAHDRAGSPFKTIDDALRRAAARGVAVRLLVSEWGANPGSLARKSIDALAEVPNVDVRVITIPPWSGGEVPFARVAHAKFAVFDRGAAAWIGTSNWEEDYFTRSRNVGVLVEGGKLPLRLAGVFEDDFASTCSRPLPAP